MSRQNLIYLLALLFFSEACKKYEEGPGISLRTKDHRMEGKWNISSYKRNGKELMNQTNEGGDSYWYCNGNQNYAKRYSTIVKIEWDVKKDGKVKILYNNTDRIIDIEKSNENCKEIYYDSIGSNTTEQTWKFDGVKRYFILGQDDDKYEIIKLKEKQVKLKREFYGGDVIEYTLDKI